jgi:hypothetical protein
MLTKCRQVHSIRNGDNFFISTSPSGSSSPQLSPTSHSTLLSIIPSSKMVLLFHYTIDNNSHWHDSHSIRFLQVGPRQRCSKTNSLTNNFSEMPLIPEDQSTLARIALLLNVFNYFTPAYLATKDTHSLTSTFGTDTRRAILSAYYLAVAALKA